MNFLTEEEILPQLVESYFMEIAFQTRRVNWKIDRLFLYQCVLIWQICLLAGLLLELHEIRPKKKGGYFSEVMNAKKNLASQIVPSISKDTYKNVLKPTNYNYFLVLSWLSEKDFVLNLLMDEFEPKEGEILKDCLASIEEDELTPLRLFYVFLITLQVG